MSHKKHNQFLKEEKTYKYNYIYEVKILSGRSKGHYYIGQHSTDDLDDGYICSGKIFWDWWHSKERVFDIDYTRRIICYCDNLDELNDCEWYYIYDKYNTDKMCWNLRAGGNKPGWDKEVIIRISKSVSKSNRERYKDPNEHIKTSEAGKKSYIENPSRRKKQSDNGHKRYEDPNEHIKTGESSKKVWDSYTEEEYNTRCNIMKESWDNKTDEQRKLHSEHTREGNIRYWNNVTDEYKLEFGEKISNIEDGSWWMTSIFDEHIYFVIPSKQQDFIDRGYYRCTRTSREPWKEIVRVIKNDKLSKGNKGAMYMTKPGEKVRYVVPEKQEEFITNGYYHCHKNGTPWEEKVA